MIGHTVGPIDIQEDPPALARRVAEWLTSAALSCSGAFRVALSGGSTPRALYELLASAGVRDRFPWDRVEWYWGDERFVSHDDPRSNYGMARDAMLSKVPVPAGNVHPMPFEGTPEAAAERYERTLQKAYGSATLDPERALFDVTLLGIGSDGHIASLLPGEPALAERRRWVVAVPHGRDEARITLTYPVLESSRRVAILALGTAKTAILRSIFAGGSTVPAARLEPLGQLVWFVDRAAAGVPEDDENRCRLESDVGEQMPKRRA